MLLGQSGVNHDAAGVGIMSQPAYREPTLAPIQTLIIRTISVELRLAGFRGVLGTWRQKKKNTCSHTLRDTAWHDTIANNWNTIRSLAWTQVSSQTRRIHSKTRHTNTHVLSAVYDLHAVYFRLKPKLIFAGSWHGQ